MATDEAHSSLKASENPVREYVNDHPFVVGFLIFEAGLIVLAFVIQLLEESLISVLWETELFSVLAGLLGALALLLGFIGVALIAALSLWSRLSG